MDQLGDSSSRGPGDDEVSPSTVMSTDGPDATDPAVGRAGDTTATTTTTTTTTTASTGTDSSRPAVFRTSRSALVAVVLLALCLSPIAFQGGPWFLLFLIPLVVAWWVLRTRTVVDPEGLTVRTAWGSTRWPWSRVATLRLVDRGWVRAVGTAEHADATGPELTLRGVRIRDLGRVGEASGGRLAAPTPAEAQAAAEHTRELEAARMRIATLRSAQASDPDAHDDGDQDAVGR